MSEQDIDLFAGAGGWDWAARELGLDPLGIEWDADACATREAAGLRTLKADVAALNPEHFRPCRMLIGSPPCPTFSAAGNGSGRLLTATIVKCMSEIADGADTRWARTTDAFHVLSPVAWEREQNKARKQHRAPSRERAQDQALRDAKMSLLVVEPLRWAFHLEPELIALEQVPDVQPIWDALAHILAAWGYSVWTGKLEAERYGVPQTRERAILMASRSGAVHPPVATHQRFVSGEPARHEITFEGEIRPWRSMAEALGWGMTERPCVTVLGSSATGGREGIDGGSGSRAVIEGLAKGRDVWVQRERSGDRAEEGFDPTAEPCQTLTEKARSWTVHRPVTNVNGDPRISPPGHHDENESGSKSNAVRVTVQEAAILQSFPPDYPWQGLVVPQHVYPGFAVEGDDALPEQFVSDLLERGVRFVVRAGVGKDDQVLEAVVVPDSVDVVYGLAALRSGHNAVLRHPRVVEHVAPVDLRFLGGASLLRLERIAVKLPLLVMPQAESASDRCAFAVLARWLGRPPLESEGAVASSLVVHEAHAFSGVTALAAFDATGSAHVSRLSEVPAEGNSRTAQFRQIGNAIPPVLAKAIIGALLSSVSAGGKGQAVSQVVVLTSTALAPCGMHGSSCPREYQPWGPAGSRDWVADSTYGRLNAGVTLANEELRS